ncbi:hypothetical protein F3Y22_tig00117048pilonHSYRG00215 [Hibiscus syriacus]|uniref:Uncharacterized protein n=1 Tax=Hibiscus syriacus TaxID=106335 RepID=A0A6A2WXK7_HIBSY|nr:hypothetical protein F3Y22_tig00117048pilonHSYRG00215 [Hibiscus syriacus]
MNYTNKIKPAKRGSNVTKLVGPPLEVGLPPIYAAELNGIGFSSDSTGESLGLGAAKRQTFLPSLTAEWWRQPLTSRIWDQMNRFVSREELEAQIRRLILKTPNLTPKTTGFLVGICKRFKGREIG